MRKVPIVRQKQVTQWPEYDRLEGGLANYWYPAMQGRRLRGKVPMQILGESVLFVRDEGEVFALAERSCGQETRPHCRNELGPKAPRRGTWCRGLRIYSDPSSGASQTDGTLAILWSSCDSGILTGLHPSGSIH